LNSVSKYSEEDLVTLLKDRREEGFAYLYDQYGGALYAAVSEVVKDQSQAADLLQDIFVEIERSIDHFDSSRSRLFTWLLYIANNKAGNKQLGQTVVNTESTNLVTAKNAQEPRVTEQEYISSGAIEACVQGTANEEDWQELAQMSQLYPAVKNAKDKIEQELEKQHIAQSHNPPSLLKQKIMHSIDFSKNEEAPVVTIADTATPTNAKPLVVPVVPVPKSVKWLQRVVACSVLLLMGSILLNFHFYSKSIGYKKEIDTTISNLNGLNNLDQKPIKLAGTTSHPTALATVYVNTENHIYLMMNNLPAPAKEKQYQLWAMVDGKLIDAGTIPTNTEIPFQRMQTIPNAQAFGITLEQEGGATTTTMDAMWVYGSK
jgi:RNA polymerase sigma factor (sigma-70 family)